MVLDNIFKAFWQDPVGRLIQVDKQKDQMT
jgi:hypothetical protein